MKFIYTSKIRLTIFAFALLLNQFVFSQAFTQSNLPIVIISTDGGVAIPDDPRVLANMKIIYRGEGMTNFVADQNNPAYLNYNGRIDIEIRGSSSQALPKKQFGLTTRLADNVSNNNVSLLGMPAENDWILNGLAFDPSLMRDYISYNLSRSMGNYASRTQYCEVIINGQYNGLYVLQEKVKADSNRVDVTKIANTHNTLPNLSGGYITKCDKTTGGDPIAWSMQTYYGGWVDFIHELPKPENVTTQQDTYIETQFINLKNNAANPSITNGYPSIIDVPSFVDFILSNELASNADGFQISTYFHKDKNGKLRAGPVWDFNLTYGNDLFLWGYDRSHYNVWQLADDENVGAKFFYDLFNNPTFKCYLARRFHELTLPGQLMNINTLTTFIDNTVNHISAAAVREQNLWGTIPNWQGEIANLKIWLNQRINWMTANLGSYNACNNITLPSLVITKINYNPGTGGSFTNSNDQEFIEIKNTGNQLVNLTGVYFRGTGFVYQFPANQMLPANASVYLASNATVFQNRYGFAANGEFTRNMSNSNQNLVLADAFGNVIDSVHYYDSAPWPNADGNGYFLELTNTALDNNMASSWTATDMNSLSTENFNSETLSVAPNPANDLLLIKTPNVISEVSIFDIGGRLIKTISAVSNNVEVNIASLSSGMYIVKVTSGDKSESRKILKM